MVQETHSVAGKSREDMREFWTEHSQNATVDDVMLDSKSEELDRLDRPEVMKLLGSVEDKRVLELGAGIGRFTRDLARTARSVHALDFMKTFVDANRAANANLGNVTHECNDAVNCSYAPESYDVVFSNWLLMYLSDEDAQALIGRILQWLTPGGTFFFRESCFGQSGDRKRKSNPTNYRKPAEYFSFIDSAEVKLDNGMFARFKLEYCRCLDCYVHMKMNQHQLCWKFTKVLSEESTASDFRAFLDKQQYSLNGILRYERIFGEGFVSTGGIDTTKEFIAKLNLTSSDSVLDIGCGIGGGDFLMAEMYGCKVHGIDLSVNMVGIALERARDKKNKFVTFEICDCTTRELEEESFDVVYSRDTILHIQDKPKLFARLLRVLKPGGRLLISDYCRAEGEATPEFAAYIEQRGYDLHSVKHYGEMLEGAGFVNVVAEDVTGMFEASLRKELAAVEAEREQYIKDFSMADYKAVTEGWKEKLGRLDQQRWGLFTANKAEN